ncbi:MAG: SMP-30/gluconolactonase/LRE family protein [Myxococcota bacterium]
MKTLRIGRVLSLVVAFGCSKKETTETQAAPEVQAPQAVALALAGIGLATPESILYDAQADQYVVSNVNGSPLAVDDNGFLSRIAPDGNVIAPKWVDGASAAVTLNAPKGMTLVGDTLYVADISAVRLFDRQSGAPKGSIDIAGATFLNDVASAPDGTVYVSDTGMKAGPQGFVPAENDAIYQIRADGSYEAIAQGEALGHPNGLAWRGDGLVVVTFGTGEVYTLTGGVRAALAKPQSGSLDGVVALANGRLLVSSWEGKCVYVLDAAGQYTRVVADVTSPADIGYDTLRKALLIPVFSEDAMRVVPLP